MPDTLNLPDQRSREILSKIKTVFNQKGFDGASMQDLARAAGMSAGNFYRYFDSKNAIVAAMVQHDLAEVAGVFRQIRSAPDPRAAFLAAFRREIGEHREACDGPLWAEIEAAANRRGEIAGITAQMEHELLRYLLETFGLIVGRPADEMAEDFTEHARLIIVIFKGIAMQPDLTPGLVDLAVSTVDLLLDRVVALSGAAAGRRIPA
ncbi:MAG: TetR/AcrR family transcriptional regulator [Rhodobacteraceae bacterium]|nr:TetR/AcrR family transcriptional regulator [Paracoccaceae bacterium]